MTVVAVISGTASGEAAEPAPFDHDYRPLALVFSAHVSSDGSVDYRSIKRDPALLNECLSLMAAVSPEEYRAWSRNQQLAFLINMYNAHTIGLVARHYPVGSIKDIGNLWQGPWGQPIVGIFGKRTSLDHLSNRLIYPVFSDPRIRFALCFGAKASPSLRREPYRSLDLDQQLDDQVRRFLSIPENFEVRKNRGLRLSEMFKWHADDFAGKQDMVSFLFRFAPADRDVEPEAENESWKYQPFDWSLNDWVR